jgi:hypothetical protein
MTQVRLRLRLGESLKAAMNARDAAAVAAALLSFLES